MGGSSSSPTTTVKAPSYTRGKFEKAATGLDALFNPVDNGASMTAADLRAVGRDRTAPLSPEQIVAQGMARRAAGDDLGENDALKTLLAQIRNPNPIDYKRFDPRKLNSAELDGATFETAGAFSPGAGFLSSDFSDNPFMQDLGEDVETAGAYSVDASSKLQGLLDSISESVGSTVKQDFAKAGRSGAISADSEAAAEGITRAIAPFLVQEEARLDQLNFEGHEAAAGRKLQADTFNAGQDLDEARFGFDTVFNPYQFDTGVNQRAFEEFAAREDARQSNQANEDFRIGTTNIDNTRADFNEFEERRKEAFDDHNEIDLRARLGFGSQAQSAAGLLPMLEEMERDRIALMGGVGDQNQTQDQRERDAPYNAVDDLARLLAMLSSSGSTTVSSGGGASPFARGLSGAASGATIGGSFGGPVGAGVGAGLGGLAGIFA